MGSVLHIQLHHDRGTPVLALVGDVDVLTASYLHAEGRSLVDEAFAERDEPPLGAYSAGRVLVLDASGVAFIDSHGLGALIAVLKRVRSHRAGFSIAGAGPELVLLLTRTGLHQVLALHACVQEAVDAAVGTGSAGSGTP